MDKTMFDEICDVLEAAGYQPRSYSGRSMYGNKCLAVCLNDVGELFLLGRAMGEQSDFYMDFGAPVVDSMGLGVVAYWPYIPWMGDLETITEGDEEAQD